MLHTLGAQFHVLSDTERHRDILTLLLLMSGDVALNPGRRQQFLCAYCELCVVKSKYVISGLSDHAAVVADSGVKPMYHKKAKTTLSLYLFTSKMVKNERRYR